MAEGDSMTIEEQVTYWKRETKRGRDFAVELLTEINRLRQEIEGQL